MSLCPYVLKPHTQKKKLVLVFLCLKKLYSYVLKYICLHKKNEACRCDTPRCGMRWRTCDDGHHSFRTCDDYITIVSSPQVWLFINVLPWQLLQHRRRM